MVCKSCVKAHMDYHKKKATAYRKTRRIRSVNPGGEKVKTKVVPDMSISNVKGTTAPLSKKKKPSAKKVKGIPAYYAPTNVYKLVQKLKKIKNKNKNKKTKKAKKSKKSNKK